MIDIEHISNIYFVGIGGIGMSALARHFNNNGVKVSGYDKTRSLLCNELELEGMKIHYDDNIELIDKDASIVVYTPAIPKDHKELNYYQKNGYQVLKRSDVLQLLTKETFNICVAGTHGKTTISTMIAHILRESGIGCTAFLGGLSVNYNTNYWSDNNKICVIEADEYDRSFLKLNPDIASISAMDADHLDIYGTPEAVEEAFIEFAGKVKKDGLLISKYELKRSGELSAINKFTYSIDNKSADIYASNIIIRDGSYYFDVISNNTLLSNFELNIGGLHNVENSLVAIKATLQTGAEIEKVKSSLANFKGVKRRFEFVVKKNSKNNIYIDDYAHHPEELKALILSAKQLFPNKQCVVVFQPHLFSRTKDLAKEFATTLDLADQVILLPIYPARELPIEGVSSSLIEEKMVLENKYLMDMTEVINWVKNDHSNNKDRLYITAGAGDIDQLVNKLQKILI